MRTRGAVLMAPAEPGARTCLEIVDLELDEPRQGEVLVKMVASGLCHSDDHLIAGDIPPARYPFAVGHEGAGVIEKVGPYTRGFEVGDHVVFSFLPACGQCRWCATGMQNLCDLGRYTSAGTRIDGSDSYRLHLLDGTPVGQMSGVGAFCEYTTVDVASAVKVPADLPLEYLCLLGCGVGTGWGSAVNSAEVRAGHTVIVMGIGGIGINAVQGAAYVGASNVIAIDPVQMKRELALKLGATYAFADIGDAGDVVRELTNGQGADSAVITIGVVTGEHVADAFGAIRKGGTVVVTGLARRDTVGIPVSLIELTLYQKRIQGSLFGAASPRLAIPLQAELFREGNLDLEQLVSNVYRLEDVNQGFEDMHAGRNIRGVIHFESKGRKAT